jgi:hypothetical protein
LRALTFSLALFIAPVHYLVMTNPNAKLDSRPRMRAAIASMEATLSAHSARAPRERIDRQLWRRLPSATKVVLLANGEVELDEDGLPVVAGALLGLLVRRINRAFGVAS